MKEGGGCKLEGFLVKVAFQCSKEVLMGSVKEDICSRRNFPNLLGLR